MTNRWECRYSSCEMMYLELAANSRVSMYLDHSKNQAEFTSFDDVLAGKLDAQVSTLFGASALEELKIAVRDRMMHPPKPYDKHAEMLRRRREG